jgi:hypothetical protein
LWLVDIYVPADAPEEAIGDQWLAGWIGLLLQVKKVFSKGASCTDQNTALDTSNTKAIWKQHKTTPSTWHSIAASQQPQARIRP